MINWGTVPLGAVLPFMFASYDGATGASEAISGLAVTDVEVYKGNSITQRASDAGYALIDTDGIDIDGHVGINGFSIDTGDNTDAGFFVAGSFYTVVVASVTADGQTVNFVAGTFRLCAAESVAGVVEADITHIGGDAQSATDLKDFADAGYDPATNKVQGVVLTDTVTTYTGNTPQTGDSFARIGATGSGLTSLATQASVDTVDANVDAILVDTGTTLDGKIDTIDTNVDSILADTGTDGVVIVNGGITAAKFGAGAIDAAALNADAGAELADALLNRDMSTGTDSGSPTVRTPRQALYAIRNKVSIAAGTLTVTKTDDTTASWTAEVTTAAGNPIDSIDPADA